MSRCACEDRPACGCVEPFSRIEWSDFGDLYDNERTKAELDDGEDDDNDADRCSICNGVFTIDDNEDDVVSGFHQDCAEND